jgi:signal transduction histidine kinase/ActR/RegA family two-component response regulator
VSIRARLLWLVLLATLPFLILIGIRFVHDRDRQIAAAELELPVLANGIARSLEEAVQGAAQLHFGLSRARDLDTEDTAACSVFLAEVRQKYPHYTGILSITPEGKPHCDSLQSGRTFDVTDRPYFKKALVAKDEVTLQAAFGRITNSAVLQIAYPVRGEADTLRFILLASLDLALFAKTHQDDLALRGREILFVDNQGTVLAWTGTNGAASMSGKSIADSALFRDAAKPLKDGVKYVAGADGSAQVWAVADSPILQEAGMRILVGQSRGALGAAEDQRFVQDMLLWVACAIVLFLGMWYLAEWSIRRHIETIANMARRLGEGDNEAHIPEPHPRGELGKLMTVLNQTAERLRQKRADIDKLNERLRQSQRLEAVGQLTGGIAHDFNNLLTVILGNAELLAERLQDQVRLAELVKMIGIAARRGADLTQRLLAFARRQPLDPRSINVNRLIADLDGLLRRTLGEHIEIEFIRGAGLWQALVDPVQLESALLNLSINARDAMPEGGRLTIETANTHVDHNYAVRLVDLAPGQYVMVAVSDNGSGIAPEILSRVFEPFFTTKETGKGTGLGLAMVYGFAKQSGGHVSIYSEPGHGTAVKLYLPRVLDEQNTIAVDTIPAMVQGGDETILLVEDDAMVRRYANDQLSSLGYRVVVAANGPSALEVLRQRDDIDLLFTDVVMPGGMSGRELADAAIQLRPNLKVLYTSGFPENSITHQGRLNPGIQLLAKPYLRADLAAQLRRALDNGNSLGSQGG